MRPLHSKFEQAPQDCASTSPKLVGYERRLGIRRAVFARPALPKRI